tara:strand:+ start:2531 stop:3115 length:585 start_codon:yes stop_codon:yes gene_type:complete
MSKTFNLNDASYDAKENAAIFNSGAAGVVENCSTRVERIKQEDKSNPNAPDYKIFFIDPNKAEVNLAFWYPKDDDTEENIIKFLKKLKHMAHCFCGSEAQLPAGNPKAILDGVMKMLRESGMSGNVRVMTNYGTQGRESQYLRVRTFVPFVESMVIDKADSRLRSSNIENFDRPAATETSGAVASTASGSDDWA